MAITIIQDLKNSYNRGDYAVVYFDDVYFADGTSGGWLKMGYNEQGNQEWMNTDEGWGPYKCMLIQKRWEDFDGHVEHY